ncbi:MAG: ribonuclease III [Acidimicrobiales bacterium]
MTTLGERLGYTFGDPAQLQRALTHRSWCAENPGHLSNERLEFLGDAVLGLIVADHAYRRFPDRGEGWLSRARASVVRATALAEMAAGLQLGDALMLGKGEDLSGGRNKASILADALEAVIGAIYIDGGWAAAQRFVLDLIGDRIERLSQGDADQDHKSRLQELCARLFEAGPRYALQEHGPEHDKEFHAEVIVGEDTWGRGTGHTKKQAEQEAAHHAIRHLAEVHAHRLPSDVVNGVLAAEPNQPPPSPLEISETFLQQDERTDA